MKLSFKTKNYVKIIQAFFILLFLFFFKVNLTYSEFKVTIKNQEVIDLVNLERTKRGKNILKENSVLNQIAQNRLDDMKNKEYFSHISPDNKKLLDWFLDLNYQFEYAGENLAINFADAKTQNQSWLESKSHKDNILNNLFTETGVAVGEVNFKGKKMILTVQVFAKPKDFNLTNLTQPTYQMSGNFSPGGLKINNVDFQLEDKKYSNLNYFSWLALILISILVLIVDFSIFYKK